MSKYNKEDNKYIMVYAIAMTLIFGTLLSVVALALKDRQDFEKLLEKQKFILTAGLGEEGLKGLEKTEISELYEQTVTVAVLDGNGKLLPDADESKIKLIKEYKKKDPADKQLPVYVVASKDNPEEVVSYVFPTYGVGLWDNIWSYLAVDGKLNTINGVVFDHVGETPGLGARITDTEVEQRWIGKTIFNKTGDLNAPDFQKGESEKYEDDPSKVQGLSGATITANGVNNMLDAYLEMYLPYIDSKKK